MATCGIQSCGCPLRLAVLIMCFSYAEVASQDGYRQIVTKVSVLSYCAWQKIWRESCWVILALLFDSACDPQVGIEG